MAESKNKWTSIGAFCLASGIDRAALVAKMNARGLLFEGEEPSTIGAAHVKAVNGKRRSYLYWRRDTLAAIGNGAQLPELRGRGRPSGQARAHRITAIAARMGRSEACARCYEQFYPATVAMPSAAVVRRKAKI